MPWIVVCGGCLWLRCLNTLRSLVLVVAGFMLFHGSLCLFWLLGALLIGAGTRSRKLCGALGWVAQVPSF